MVAKGHLVFVDDDELIGPDEELGADHFGIIVSEKQETALEKKIPKGYVTVQGVKAKTVATLPMGTTVDWPRREVILKSSKR